MEGRIWGGAEFGVGGGVFGFEEGKVLGCEVGDGGEAANEVDGEAEGGVEVALFVGWGVVLIEAGFGFDDCDCCGAGAIENENVEIAASGDGVFEGGEEAEGVDFFGEDEAHLLFGEVGREGEDGLTAARFDFVHCAGECGKMGLEVQF